MARRTPPRCPSELWGGHLTYASSLRKGSARRCEVFNIHEQNDFRVHAFTETCHHKGTGDRFFGRPSCPEGRQSQAFSPTGPQASCANMSRFSEVPRFQ